jgi:hypothetical protein
MKLLPIWSLLIIVSLSYMILGGVKGSYMFGQESSLNDSATSRNAGISWLIRLGGMPPGNYFPVPCMCLGCFPGLVSC